MSEKDQRRSERVIPARQPSGQLSLYVDGECFDIKEVRDVSPFGIGVRTDADLGKATEVRLHYQHGDEAFEVFGVIAWGSQVEADKGEENTENLYRIGVCLRPEDAEANLNFYRAMVSQKL